MKTPLHFENIIMSYREYHLAPIHGLPLGEQIGKLAGVILFSL